MHQLRSQLLSFAFKSERLFWLGLPRKRILQLALAAVLVLGVLFRVWWLAVLCIIIFLLLMTLYPWARRLGYTTFIPDTNPLDPPTSKQMETDVKIPIRGTGRFLIGKKERRLLLASGKCWQLPVGEIALMLEAAPGHFGYQFIDPQAVEQVRYGKLWFGNQHEIGLEVVFQTDWVQENESFEMGWQKTKEEGSKQEKRTILMTFDEVEQAQQVWRKLARN